MLDLRRSTAGEHGIGIGLAEVAVAGADRAHDVRRRLLVRRAPRPRPSPLQLELNGVRSRHCPAGRARRCPFPMVMRRPPTSPSALAGRLITVAGSTALCHPEGTDLGRVVIVCCAADAQPAASMAVRVAT